MSTPSSTSPPTLATSGANGIPHGAGQLRRRGSMARTAGALTACALAAGAFFSLRSGMFAQPVRAAVELPAVTPGAGADGIIDVPSEARSLQLALDAATSGQTVRLAPGTFEGGVHLGSTAIRLVGAGAGVTMIAHTGRGPVLEVDARPGVDIKIADLSISGGRGVTGAGLVVTAGSVEARHVAFNGNEGSAVVTLSNAQSVFVDCTFTGNRSGFAGGALCNTGGKVMLVNCGFDGNTAQTFGGAVYSLGGSVDTIACTFTENLTTSGAFGGAVFGQDAALQVAGTSFERNESREAGGAMFLRGGTAVIDRCKFTGNLAEGAWALYSSGAGVRIARSTLCGDAEHLLGGDLAQGAGNAFDTGCFPDCNQNGVSDADEIARGWAHDVDGNGVPDDCDVDWNQNGIPDAYEIMRGFAQDANGNGMIDTCEIRLGLARDEDHNLVPDDAISPGADSTPSAGRAAAKPTAKPAANQAASPAAAPAANPAPSPAAAASEPKLTRHTLSELHGDSPRGNSR